jgi:hypothetical protein
MEWHKKAGKSGRLLHLVFAWRTMGLSLTSTACSTWHIFGAVLVAARTILHSIH